MAIQSNLTGETPLPLHPFKPMPNNPFQLSPGRLEIWEYALRPRDTKHDGCLSPAERERAQNFYFDKHRQRFIGARTMLRRLLARYVQQTPESLRFTENRYGKPQLITNESLQFNLSHSGERALLAVGMCAPVGIDLEYFKARDYHGIAKQMFSVDEYHAFAQLPVYLQPLAFYHIWVQKEALIKAAGLGLSYPTQQFTVPVRAPTQQRVADERHQKTWNMISWMPTNQCYAAMCYDPSIQEIFYGQADDFTL